MLESLTLVSFISGRITAGTSSTMLSGGKKRRANLIRAKKLFEASINSDMELLKEMKSVKQGGKVCDELPEHVAGTDGQTEIVEKFREVYEVLYNYAGSGQEMDQIKARMAKLIGAL